MAKWWWRVKSDKEALWSQVIYAIYGYRRNRIIDPLESKKGGIWGRIIAIKKHFADLNIDLPAFFQADQSAGTITWRCNLLPSGEFSVAAIRSIIDKSFLDANSSLKTSWIKLLPSKMNMLVWRMSRKRLATFENLARRNIIQEPKQCVLCNLSLESEEHLFLDCMVAQSLMQMIADWWSVPNSPHLGSGSELERRCIDSVHRGCFHLLLVVVETKERTAV